MKGIRVQLICVGKMKEKFYIDAAAEYVKRLSAYCKLQVVELPEERLPEDPSPAQIEAALLKEAAAIRAKLPSGAALIALCVEGEPRSSEALARQMAAWASQGVGHLVFLIGGSFGLHPSIKAEARLRLSMSPMTFPHHLARVMLLEQLYRSFKIDEGSNLGAIRIRLRSLLFVMNHRPKEDHVVEPYSYEKTIFTKEDAKQNVLYL